MPQHRGGSAAAQSLLGKVTHSHLEAFPDIPECANSKYYHIKPQFLLFSCLVSLGYIFPPTRCCLTPAWLCHLERGLAGAQCYLPPRLLYLLHPHRHRSVSLFQASSS